MNVISTHTIQGKQYDLVEHPEKQCLPCSQCAFDLDTRACETAPDCCIGPINRIFIESKGANQ